MFLLAGFYSELFTPSSYVNIIPFLYLLRFKSKFSITGSAVLNLSINIDIGNMVNLTQLCVTETLKTMPCFTLF